MEFGQEFGQEKSRREKEKTFLVHEALFFCFGSASVKLKPFYTMIFRQSENSSKSRSTGPAHADPLTLLYSGQRISHFLSAVTVAGAAL